MKVAVVYVFPGNAGEQYTQHAIRFLQSYNQNPPGVDHESIVVLNGIKLCTEIECLFAPLKNVRFLEHDNSGKDLGAYQLAARSVSCDLMVCMGSPLRLRVPGWLAIIKQSFQQYGHALFGNWCFHVPAPHVRTTFFWLPPQILNAYPHPINDSTRYQVEHGANSLTQWCMSKKIPVLQCTVAGIFDIHGWHHVSVGNCLALDQHWARYGI